MPRSKNVKNCMKNNDGPIVDITSYVSLNREFLKFVGLHPKNGARSLIAIFFMLLLLLPQVLQIYYSHDLSVILETSSVLLSMIPGFLKIIIWSVRQHEFNDFITYMFDDYWNMIKFEEKSATDFLRYATFSKAFTKCYLFLIGNALLFFYGLPLVQIPISKIKGLPNKIRVYPFPGLYPEGWTESPFYEMVVVSQIFATGSCAVIVLAIDTLLATAVFHTCGHFKIVQNNLRRLGDDVDRILNPVYNRGNEKSLKFLVRRKFRIYIKHHQAILRFSETLERLFNPIILCQVLASMMLICLVGLQMSTALTDRGKLLKYFFYLLMALFQLILFCLPGDDLINQSLAVSDAAYATNWHKVSKLLKSDVKFTIIRSQKPAMITAGKFTVMSLEHFGTVLSTSISYFTVLRSLC